MNIDLLEKNKIVKRFIEFNHELFSSLLVTYLLLLLAEIIWAGSVSSYLNTDYLLIIVIISGVIAVVTRKEEEEFENVEVAKKDFLFIGILGIAGSLIIWYKLKYIGNLAYLISIMTGLPIVLLPLLLYTEDENDG